jgi:hypothetical protein
MTSWRKLHNEVLHNLDYSPKYYKGDQIKDDKMGRVCNAHGRDEK